MGGLSGMGKYAPPSKGGDKFHAPSLFTPVYKARAMDLKLCATPYENAEKRSISMWKI